MVQTLARPDRATDLLRAYGHVVIDECHHVPASRYLHARPATERAAAFTAAFGGSVDTASYTRGRESIEQPDEP